MSNALLGFSMFMGVLVLGVGALAFKYKSDLDIIRGRLGKDFVNGLLARAPGVLVAKIRGHVVEFGYLKTRDRDGEFYVEKVKDPVSGEEVHHRLIKKKDLFYINGKVPIAFVLEDKIRAINLSQIKALEGAKLANVMGEIMRDYRSYLALQETYKALASQMNFASEDDVVKLSQRMAEIQGTLKALREKWGVIFAPLDEGNDVLLEDDEGTKVLIRPINFDEFTEVTTGATPTAIINKARDIYRRWTMEFLKDVVQMFKIPEMRGLKSSGWPSWLIWVLLLLLGGAALIKLIG